jgi:hypothetical protein
MHGMKKYLGLIMGLAIVLSATVFASCSTVPKAAIAPVSYSVLGPVEGTFGKYEDALAAAKKLYPKAEAVIFIKSAGGNKMIPFPVKLGYWAVDFN